MDDNWDLFAVVRANLKAKRVTNPTAAANDPLPSFPSDLPPIYGEQNSYGFPALGDEMNNPYLQEIYYGFRYGNQAPPNPNPNPTAVVDDPAFFVQPRQDFMQENVQFVSPAIDSPPRNLSAATTLQRTKKGRRKNYQPKLIRQMTKEEVHTDLWSWRKYGQKPIKGVLNPRSYYKCSTSKGCAARKQVELFTENPETYVVTYAGEHTHPRPTRRSSLSGSTRTRFANPARAKNGGRTKKGSSSSSTAPAPPPAAGGIFSPDTPSTESEATEFYNDLSDLYDGAAEENEENIDMLVNDLLNDEDDDFFIGFDDSDDFSGGDDFFPTDFLESPQWNFDGGEFDGNGGF